MPIGDPRRSHGPFLEQDQHDVDIINITCILELSNLTSTIISLGPFEILKQPPLGTKLRMSFDRDRPSCSPIFTNTVNMSLLRAGQTELHLR